MEAWKPGLPFRGGTLLSTAVGTALAAGCRVLVVAGNRADSIPAALEGLRGKGGPAAGGVEIFFHPEWALGMQGSLQAGMARVATRRFFVLPADMPFVPVRAFAALAREAEARDAQGLADAPVFPVFRGEPGHPVLIPSALIPEARDLPKDGRFRDFLYRLGPVFIAVEDPGIRMDLDTRPDYEQALCSAC